LRAGAELGGVGLADRYRSGRPETLYDQVVLRGDVPAEQARAKGGANPPGRHQILVGDGESVERSQGFAVGLLLIGGSRSLEGAVGVQRDDGVELGIEPLDLGKVRLHHLARGEFPLANAVRQVDCGREADLRIGQVSSSGLR
jgi:hypothetical protein